MNSFDINSIENKMQNTIDNLINNFHGIRTGRASTGLVDNILVNAYGQKMKIKDLHRNYALKKANKYVGKVISANHGFPADTTPFVRSI